MFLKRWGLTPSSDEMVTGLHWKSMFVDSTVLVNEDLVGIQVKGIKSSIIVRWSNVENCVGVCWEGVCKWRRLVEMVII